MKTRFQQRPTFAYISEPDDRFLSLFPHRFDYIWAEHPDPGDRPQWQTESRHPLADRHIHQGSYLYGVRFSAETKYCLLDLDAGSTYHPNHDPFAITRITAALEPLGLVRHLTCTSSYSGGLHLYFPFQTPQSSWELAIVLTCLLENAGFKIKPGQLEIFPNPRPYSPDPTLSLFNGHRLPMQAGSYLLDDSLQPILSDTDTFAKQWQLAQQHNDINQKRLKQILKQAKRKHFGITGKANKFLNDLNAEIELGWTGSGQTNRLLGRITMRAYIFGHTINGGEPLEDKALVHETMRVAQSLPGYQDFCRHQHEIEKRSQDWGRSIEANPRYYHFDRSKSQSSKVAPECDPNQPTWNQQQQQAARERIRSAIAQLLDQNKLPITATARANALKALGINKSTLYNHPDLWHPASLLAPSKELQPRQRERVHPVEPNIVPSEELQPRQRERVHPVEPNKLVPLDAAPQGQASEHLIAGGCGGLSTGSDLLEPEQGKVSPQLLPYLLCYHLDTIKQAQNLLDPEPSSFKPAPLLYPFEVQQKVAKQNQAYRDKMQRWMDTGDPILVAEVAQYFARHPEPEQESPPPPAIHTPAIGSPPAEPQEQPNQINHHSDFGDILSEIAHQASRLNWDDRALRLYTADQFRGKRQSQLNYNELILLLVELRRLE